MWRRAPAAAAQHLWPRLVTSKAVLVNQGKEPILNAYFLGVRGRAFAGIPPPPPPLGASASDLQSSAMGAASTPGTQPGPPGQPSLPGSASATTLPPPPPLEHVGSGHAKPAQAGLSLPLTHEPATARPQQLDLSVGTQLRVECSGWSSAHIVELSDTQVKVAFTSYEWIARDSPRLRLAETHDGHLPGIASNGGVTPGLGLASAFGSTADARSPKPFTPKPYNPEKEFQKRQLRLKEKIASMQREKLGSVDPSLSEFTTFSAQEVVPQVPVTAAAAAVPPAPGLPPPPPPGAQAGVSASAAPAAAAGLPPPPPVAPTIASLSSSAAPAAAAELPPPPPAVQPGAPSPATASVPAQAPGGLPPPPPVPPPMTASVPAAPWGPPPPPAGPPGAAAAAAASAPAPPAAAPAAATTAFMPPPPPSSTEQLPLAGTQSGPSKLAEMPAVPALPPPPPAAAAEAGAGSVVRWKECLTEDKKYYYHEVSTGRVQWDLPSHGWVALVDEDGSLYYWDPVADVTQWDLPTVSATPAA